MNRNRIVTLIACALAICVGWFAFNYSIANVHASSAQAAAESIARRFPPIGDDLSLVAQIDDYCMLLDDEHSQMLVVRVSPYYGDRWQFLGYWRVELRPQPTGD